MRKYKLITQFPGSPLSGTIVKEDARGQYVKENPLEIFDKKDIENHPVFWEEICIECGESKPTCAIIKKCGKFKEEPNYLITAFRLISDGEIVKIGSDGKYGYWFTLKDMLSSPPCVESGDFEIYSVKNSKGEEFTIGDNAFFKTTLEWQNITSKILKFDLLENFILATTEDRQGNIEFLFKDKVKQPLYTTTDGVDVFKGDVIQLYLLTEDLKTQHKAKIDYFNAEDRVVADRYLTFTSEENRDEYIKENTRKAVLVTADGKEIFEGDTIYHFYKPFEYIMHKSIVRHNTIYGDVIFYTEEKAKEYIDNNKPKFSLADVEKAYKKLMYHDFPDAKSIISELKKLGK
jgi:hypothetical protein